MINKLANCNTCGSNETHVRQYTDSYDIITCFKCGTIQTGKVTINGFIPISCYICNRDITKVDENTKVPIWNEIVTGSKGDVAFPIENKKAHVCYNCYELWKNEVHKHDNELRNDRDNKIREAKERRKQERLDELNRMTKEKLIDAVQKLEIEIEELKDNRYSCYDD